MKILHKSGVWNSNTKKLQHLSDAYNPRDIPLIYTPMGHMMNYGHFLLDGMYSLFMKIHLLNLSASDRFDILLCDPLNRLNRSHVQHFINIIQELFNPRHIFFEPGDLLYNHFVIGERITDTGSSSPSTSTSLSRLRDELIAKNYITNDDYWLFNYNNDCCKILDYLRNDFKKNGFVFNDAFKFNLNQSSFKMFTNYIIKKLNLEDIQQNPKLVTFALSNHRLVFNMIEIANVFREYGYTMQIVDFGKLSFRDQVLQSVKSKIIIGTPGGPLTNGIFLQNNSKITSHVIELWPPMVKFFYKQYYVHDAALLLSGNTLINCDKLNYDHHNDKYSHLGTGLHTGDDWVIRDTDVKTGNSILKLKDSHKNYNSISSYPKCVMYNLVDVSFTVELDSLKNVITKYIHCPS